MTGPNERDEIAAVLDPHWRTDCSDAVGDAYVRWVRCRCGWESERSGSRINAPDMHRVWNEHLADLLAERDRRTAAAAVREAGDEFRRFANFDNVRTHGDAIDWLRDRADQIKRGQ